MMLVSPTDCSERQNPRRRVRSTDKAESAAALGSQHARADDGAMGIRAATVNARGAELLLAGGGPWQNYMAIVTLQQR